MKQVKLTIGMLCLSLAQLYHSGIAAGDALALLAEGNRSAPWRIRQMAENRSV